MLVSLTEEARKKGIHERRARRLVERGSVEAVRINGGWAVAVGALDPHVTPLRRRKAV